MTNCEPTHLVRRRSAQTRPPLVTILLRLFHVDAFQQRLEISLARLPGDLSALGAVAEFTFAPKVAVAYFDKTLTAGVVTGIGLACGCARQRPAASEHTLELFDTECAVPSCRRAAASAIGATAGSTVG
jgi:hypothetical protein